MGCAASKPAGASPAGTSPLEANSSGLKEARPDVGGLARESIFLQGSLPLSVNVKRSQQMQVEDVSFRHHSSGPTAARGPETWVVMAWSSHQILTGLPLLEHESNKSFVVVLKGFELDRAAESESSTQDVPRLARDEQSRSGQSGSRCAVEVTVRVDLQTQKAYDELISFLTKHAAIVPPLCMEGDAIRPQMLREIYREQTPDEQTTDEQTTDDSVVEDGYLSAKLSWAVEELPGSTGGKGLQMGWVFVCKLREPLDPPADTTSILQQLDPPAADTSAAADPSGESRVLGRWGIACYASLAQLKPSVVMPLEKVRHIRRCRPLPEHRTLELLEHSSTGLPGRSLFLHFSLARAAGDMWMRAICRELLPTLSQPVLAKTIWEDDGDELDEQDERWRQLLGYLQRIVEDTPQGKLSLTCLTFSHLELLHLKLMSTKPIDEERCLMRKLTARFIAHTLGKDNVLPLANRPNDLRWARYTEHWCRFLWLFTGKTEADDGHPKVLRPLHIVRSVMLCCTVDKSLQTKLLNVKTIDITGGNDKCTVLWNEVNHMESEITRWVELKSLRSFEPLLDWLHYTATEVNGETRWLRTKETLVRRGVPPGQQKDLITLKATFRSLCVPEEFSAVLLTEATEPDKRALLSTLIHKNVGELLDFAARELKDSPGGVTGVLTAHSALKSALLGDDASSTKMVTEAWLLALIDHGKEVESHIKKVVEWVCDREAKQTGTGLECFELVYDCCQRTAVAETLTNVLKRMQMGEQVRERQAQLTHLIGAMLTPPKIDPVWVNHAGDQALLQASPALLDLYPMLKGPERFRELLELSETLSAATVANTCVCKGLQRDPHLMLWFIKKCVGEARETLFGNNHSDMSYSLLMVVLVEELTRLLEANTEADPMHHVLNQCFEHVLASALADTKLPQATRFPPPAPPGPESLSWDDLTIPGQDSDSGPSVKFRTVFELLQDYEYEVSLSNQKNRREVTASVAAHRLWLSGNQEARSKSASEAFAELKNENASSTSARINSFRQETDFKELWQSAAQEVMTQVKARRESWSGVLAHVMSAVQGADGGVQVALPQPSHPTRVERARAAGGLFDSPALRDFVNGYLAQLLKSHTALMQDAGQSGNATAAKQQNEQTRRLHNIALVLLLVGVDTARKSRWPVLPEFANLANLLLPSASFCGYLTVAEMRGCLRQRELSGRDVGFVSHLLDSYLQDSLLHEPAFWAVPVLELFSGAALKVYSSIVHDKNGVISSDGLKLYYGLLEFCIRVLSVQSQGGELDPKQISATTNRVLDALSRDDATITFFREELFGEILSRVQSPDGLQSFAHQKSGEPHEYMFDLKELVPIAHAGLAVQRLLVKIPNAEKREQATQNLKRQFKGYLVRDLPHNWASAFKSSEKNVYNLVYMFREDVEEAVLAFGRSAKRIARPEVRQVIDNVLAKATKMLGGGLVDQRQLAETDFLQHKELLVEAVRKKQEGWAKSDPMWLIADITAAFMTHKITDAGLPITPHHTQVMAMLMFSQFFELCDNSASGSAFETLFLQMQTGEGKSLVIAMLAVFVVRHYNLRVHVLENNEGLLKRDFAEYKPLYKLFGLSCNTRIDGTSDICYCLKKENNDNFKKELLEGRTGKKSLDELMAGTILIVDEVDDLVVDEEPTTYYGHPDFEQTEAKFNMDGDNMRCLKAIKAGTGRPKQVDVQTWEHLGKIVEDARTKKEGEDYQLGTDENGNMAFIYLECEEDADGNKGPPKPPKVPKTTLWLQYLNFEKFGTPIVEKTIHLALCTPYLYRKYRCIFGLTGSVGGNAEKAYIEKTYSAISFEVPQFLNTCKMEKPVPVNKGVRLLDTRDEMIGQVVATVKAHYRDVPVLVITRDKLELADVHDKLKEVLVDSGEYFTADDLLRYEERDANGKLLEHEWGEVVKRATWRNGAKGAEYCNVTVTDYFGGRGVDYSCDDPAVDANGGLMVVVTSIPNEREWIQWKGRTARQDKNGQFAVVLSKDDPIFEAPDFLCDFENEGDSEKRIKMLLDRQNRSTGSKLDNFSDNQARGWWLNELCLRYYKKNPRAVDAKWPFCEDDKKLRDDILDNKGRCLCNGAEIKTLAAELGVDLVDPPPAWECDPERNFALVMPRAPKVQAAELGGQQQAADGVKDKAVIIMIDCSAPKDSRNIAIERVKWIFNNLVFDNDLIGYKYFGGTEWIFELRNKDDSLLSQIEESNTKQGGPALYKGIQDALTQFQALGQSSRYSKWLILLSDTVDSKTQALPQPENAIAKRVAALRAKMDDLDDFTLAFINTHGFKAESSDSQSGGKKKKIAFLPKQEVEKTIDYEKDFAAAWKGWQAAVQTLTSGGNHMCLSATDVQSLNKAMEEVKEQVQVKCMIRDQGPIG